MIQFPGRSATRPRADVRTAAAAVREIHATQLDLDYAHVKCAHRPDGSGATSSTWAPWWAPADNTAAGTEMVRYSPVYVYFNLSERDRAVASRSACRSLREAVGSWSTTTSARATLTPIEVGLARRGGLLPIVGRIDYTGLRDGSRDRHLRGARRAAQRWPALDRDHRCREPVRARAHPDRSSEEQCGAGESQRALGADQGGRFVLVVGLGGRRRAASGTAEGPGSARCGSSKRACASRTG